MTDKPRLIRYSMASRQSDYYCNTRSVELRGRLIWKISGFTEQCSRGSGDKSTSSTFHIPGDETDWHLNLYPNGEKDSEGYISLFLHSSVQEEMFVHCEFSIIPLSGKKCNKRKFSEKHNFYRGHGFSKFVPQSKLFEEKATLLPNDELTICCIITRKAEVSRHYRDMLQEDRFPDNSLSEDWARCYDERNKTDIVLKVGNEQISVHKIVLTTRSPVFASMFDHDMLEKDTNEVVVTDVDFDVLGGLVRFLYTGEISIHNVDFALNTLIAADKYDVPSLKARCVSFLNVNVSPSCVFQVLEVANACNERELIQNCMRLIEREMSSVSCLTDWISKLNERPNVLPLIQKLLEEMRESEDNDSM